MRERIAVRDGCRARLADAAGNQSSLGRDSETPARRFREFRRGGGGYNALCSLPKPSQCPVEG